MLKITLVFDNTVAADMAPEEFINYYYLTDRGKTELKYITNVEQGNYDPVSEDDHIITIQEFFDACQSGSFIDYDGYACYMKDGFVHTNITLSPSYVIKNGLDRSFKYVVWYNR